VLGFSINGAAAMARISKKEYHTQLRKVYLQLASLEVGAYAIAGMLGPIALALRKHERAEMDLGLLI
jgi:hypothetical protein